jgi:hypothetical protein
VIGVLGIVEGAYTPRVARILTRAIAVMTEQDAAGLLAEVGTAAFSQATLSRLPRVIAARYEIHREVIEPALRARDVIPDAAVTVQVALDGVMVPQDGEEARPRGRKTDSPEPPRHEQRYGLVGAPGPRAKDRTMGRAWQEGAVATLAFFDDEGTRLKTTNNARMPEPHKATTVDMLEKELHAVLQERPDVDIALASDGAAAQWAALEGIKARLPPELHGANHDARRRFPRRRVRDEGRERNRGQRLAGGANPGGNVARNDQGEGRRR